MLGEATVSPYRRYVAGHEDDVAEPLDDPVGKLSVDGGQARRYPFTFCNQGGCVARVGFTQAEIDQFKRGNAATVRLVPAAAPDQEIVLSMSLKGFTAGFDGTYDIPQ